MIETDALVIGAGPVGLFQVFQLGLLEMRAHVVDVLPHLGGQCTELYPNKPIYDIPGLPVATGQELVDRLAAQAAPMKPVYHLGQMATELRAGEDGRWQVGTSAGTRFAARSVFIAAGTGAFLPRSPTSLTGLDAHLGHQAWHYSPGNAAVAGHQVVVLGDDDLALGNAMELAERGDAAPARVTLVHRRDQFRASPAVLSRFMALRASGVLHFVAGQPTALLDGRGQPAEPGQVQTLEVLTPVGSPAHLPMDTLLVCLGLSPRLGPITHWGMALERKQLVVDTARLETSLPGIHAVGDVNTYPGKRKLLLCGFHEATLAAYAAAERLRGVPVQLQYTTTSPRLHQLLGVDTPERG